MVHSSLVSIKDGCLGDSFFSFYLQVSKAATRMEETTKLFDQFKRRGLTRNRLEATKAEKKAGCASDSNVLDVD